MKYKVKVIEQHVGYVWVEAPDGFTAKVIAPHNAECEFNCVYDCEIIEQEEDAN